MSAKKTDISQIRKYLAGELDARAMHQLEREAQDDPFLMDALEGYSVQPADQQAQLEELQNKLHQRVNKGKVYRMPFRIIAVAASVLIVSSVAYLLWPTGKQAQVKQIAAVIPKTTPPPTLADTLLKPGSKQQLAANTISEPKVSQQEALSQANPPSPANARVSLMAATATPDAGDKKADTAARTALAYQPKKNDSLGTNMALAAAKQPAATNTAGAEPVKMMRAAVMAKITTLISGIVSDETGHPLAGASINEKGKTGGVKTDGKGKFSLPGQDGELLSITHAGYDDKDVKGDTHDSLNVILRPTNKSISEMVAIDFGRSVATEQVNAAHPQIGWDRYNAYLKARAFLTEGKEGTVRVSFMVDSKGQLSNFKITKTLSPAADELAISIVKDGPQWFPDVSGTTKTIGLKIEFKLQR